MSRVKAHIWRQALFRLYGKIRKTRRERPTDGRAGAVNSRRVLLLMADQFGGKRGTVNAEGEPHQLPGAAAAIQWVSL